MTNELISVKEFAEANGLLRQTVFKVIKRLGIEPQKTRGGRQNRGQTISYIRNRFKVGFASNLNERLRQHRCSAPFAEVLNTWPCRRLWEKTAIECVTNGCEQLHTEVFRAESLEAVEAKCVQFFNLMPQLLNEKST